MGGTLQAFALGEPRPANVGEIEAGLSAMWRSAAEASGAESAVTRASALTLLVYVDCEEAAREVSNLLAEVTRQNPCRAVVMVMDPEGSPPGLMASVSAHCHMPVGGRKADLQRTDHLECAGRDRPGACQRGASPHGFRVADLPLVAGGRLRHARLF